MPPTKRCSRWPAALAVLIAVSFAAGIVAGRLRPTLPAASLAETRPPARALAVPDVRQSTDFSCGAAALQAVLGYWGIDAAEGELITELASDPEQGTPPEAIVRGAQARGLRVRLRENMSLGDLARELRGGSPVIVAIQAWRPEASAKGGWAEEWGEGHYVVVVGVDEGSVTVEDPSLLGARGFIPAAEFVERWHDVDGARRRWVHLGIAIEGDSPAAAGQLVQVE